jgi:hypothetical protein
LKGQYNHVAWIEYRRDVRERFLGSIRYAERIDGGNDAERWERTLAALSNCGADTLIFMDNYGLPSDLDYTMEALAGINAKIVMTSRMNDVEGFSPVELSFLSEDECVDVFYHYYKFDKEQHSSQWVRELVGLASWHTFTVELLAKAANRPGYSLRELGYFQAGGQFRPYTAYGSAFFYHRRLGTSHIMGNRRGAWGLVFFLQPLYNHFQRQYNGLHLSSSAAVGAAPL